MIRTFIRFQRNTVSFFLLFLMASPLLAQQNISQFQLQNGLSVFLQPDPSQKEVFGMVVVKAGAKDDPSTATGLAHYMEHMLFKGTQEIGTTNWEAEKPYLDTIIQLYDDLAATKDEALRSDIQKEINRVSLKANEFVINNELWSLLMQMGGTNLNAGTAPDATYYFNSFPPGQIEKWLEVYSHRFIEPVFRGFQAELEVVYEEKNMYSDEFFSVLLETFNKSFFKNHPYGQQTTIGSIEHLKNPQLSKMIDFYRTYYVANNMALILVGDFDVQTIRPVIEEKFGRLKSGKVPEKQVVAEDSFDGREFESGRYSPIKLGILGFRTVPKLHPNKLAVDLANGVLSNSGQNGLLDRTILNNDILAAMVVDMPYLDHGASYFIFIPKIIGQSLKKGEKIVLEQLDSLKAGKFDEALLESLKLEKYRDFQLGLENGNQRAMLMAEAFVTGQRLEQVFDYPKRIMAITKDDVVRAANQYYDENYLAFYSKMGKAKTEKIEKPGYEPIISNRDAQSDYVNALQAMEQPAFEYQPVDLESEVEILAVNKNAKLQYVKNPVNDIFSFKVQFQVGEQSLPGLFALSTALTYAGTRKHSPLELKTAFANTGTSFYTTSNDNFFEWHFTGPDKNLAQVVSLYLDMLNGAQFDKIAVKKIWEEEALNRKMEDATPRAVSNALLEYVVHGEQSVFLDRLTKKEIKKIDADYLSSLLDTLKSFPVNYQLVSALPSHEAVNLLKRSSKTPEKISKPQPYFTQAFKSYAKPTIFFVNDKKALQSNIHFYVMGEDFQLEDRAAQDAFNTYFGGSFSGIVMQEIREFRSLSYAASGSMQSPRVSGGKNTYLGYVGTQADKTLEAIKVYTDLLQVMPQKPERMNMIRDYLYYSGQMRKPDFRYKISWIEDLRRRGYQQDPYEFLQNAYRELEFDDIRQFHDKHLKDNPIVITIVGDKKRIDMDELAKFGEIIEVKKKVLFKP